MIAFALIATVVAGSLLDPQVTSILNGPIAFGVVWLMNRLNSVDKRLTRIEAVLDIDGKHKKK
jgi:hypothetical protein